MAGAGGLRPEINAWYLWSLAVGLVISGEYFGWNYGWGAAGTLGFLVTTLIVAVLYIAFIFSFTELTTAIPHAGGPFAYALRAFGPVGGLIADYTGVLAAILFAIWFFLAIEGVAMVAEEVKDPHTTMPRGYLSGALTLVVLAVGVMIFAGGVGDSAKLARLDYPLPEAMAQMVGRQSGLIHMLVAIGLFGLLPPPVGPAAGR